MNSSVNKDVLKATLEELRVSKYPEIPQSLIAKIIDVQSEYVDNETQAHANIKSLIQDYLGTLSISEE